ncbi:MAG: ABC transporter permease [Actinobacteria bacterium]|nr:ABC transporter permease [Actinomycetota bacterium]
MRLGFFFREALGSLRRNWIMSLAAVLTVFISMAILGLVLVMQDNLNSGATSLKNRVMIEVFIKKDTGPNEIKAMEAKIADMSEVKNYRFVTEEQALEEFKERLGENADQLLANLTTNPLPASFRIFVNDANQVDAVAARFFDDPIVDNSAPGKTDGVSYAKETVRKMLGTISLVTKAMWGGTALFAVAGVLLIMTTVRLSIFARRNEIEIMRLVGATNWFIRWPFVLEGFITGFIGSLVAALAIWGVNFAVFDWIEGSSLRFLSVQMYPLWLQNGVWPLGMLPTLVLFGALLGAVGSAIAMRRYLKV